MKNDVKPFDAVPDQKKKQRKEIEKQIAEFIKKGGKIQKIEPGKTSKEW